MGAYFSASSPFLALGCEIMAGVAVFRARLVPSLLKSLFWGFAAGTVFLGVLEVLFFQSNGVLTGDLLTYIFFSYVYFHFVNMGETARRIRLLRELQENPDGLSQQELLARYPASEILSRRLERLIKNRQVIVQDGRLFVGRPQLLWMAAGVALLKTFLFGRRMTFE